MIRHRKGVFNMERHRKETDPMSCQKCGAKNIAEANYCRLCGTSFRVLAKSALSLCGLPYYGRAFRPLFIGLAFLILASISIFAHVGFFWWMLFPAITMISKGIRRLTLMQSSYFYNAPPQRTRMLDNGAGLQVPSEGYGNVQARPTGELITPPSVTENTTKLLDVR
jgi:ribosomal protein L40E